MSVTDVMSNIVSTENEKNKTSAKHVVLLIYNQYQYLLIKFKATLIQTKDFPVQKMYKLTPLFTKYEKAVSHC